MTDEQRIERLEAQIGILASRVSALESGSGAPRARVDPAPPEPQPRPPVVARPAPAEPLARALSAMRPPGSVEDLLGGRVLAWLGGTAVLLGIAFLFAVAISRSWIGEGVRTLLGGGGSAGLLLAGMRLHEREVRNDAARAATAAGIAGLFVTLTVAARVYDLLPVQVALVLALGVGALATVLAIRWEARGVAALGILGALLAPVLADAPSDAGTLALLLVANASAVGVVIWRRWGWLSLLAYALATPQWLVWLFASPQPAGALAVLCAFGALGFASGVGYELRVQAAELRSQSAFLVALNAVILAAAGWFALAEIGHETIGKLFLAALASAHVAIGLRPARLARVSREIGLLLLALGVALADIAFALTVDGVAVGLGFTATGIGFAALARRARLPGDAVAQRAGLGGHLALALLHVLMVDAPPALIADGASASPASATGVLALAAGCLVSGRLADDGQGTLRRALDAIGLAAVAYVTALTLGGAELVLAWSLEGCALAAISRRRRDDLAGLGALAFLAAALLHALSLDAPAAALLYGLDHPGPAALALGASALALAVCARPLEWLEAKLRPWLLTSSAVVALYLVSVEIATAFQPTGAASDSALLDLGVRQQGQVVLSGCWSLVGFAALVTGLVRDSRPVRIGGLSLLLVAGAKVLLFDLATLDALYRVASLVGLGVLLLVGAFLWQRARPASLPDVRQAPDGAG